MLDINVSVEGVEAMASALDDIFGDLTPAIEQGVMSGAEIVRRAAKSLVPVDSGELRRSIIVNGPHNSDGAITAEVTATAEHAVYVEYGTGPEGLASNAPGAAEAGVTYHTGAYTRKKGGKTVNSGGQAAQPFMYPTFMMKRSAVSKAIARAVRKAVGGE